MFERFTDSARQVVVLANNNCQKLENSHILTTHMLLGVLEEGENLGARVLLAAGITYQDAYEITRQLIPPANAPLSGHIPFAPAAKQIFESGMLAANELKHNYIAPEHLLLGLLKGTEHSPATKEILAKSGCTVDELRERVIMAIAETNPGLLSVNQSMCTIEIEPELRAAVLQKYQLLEAFLRNQLDDVVIPDPWLAKIFAALQTGETGVLTLKVSEFYHAIYSFQETYKKILPDEHPFAKLFGIISARLAEIK